MAVTDWVSAQSAARSLAFARVVGLFVFSVAVVAWRRPDQIAAPILWFEEGTQILTAYADCGLCALFRPINGNIALSANLLLLPIFKIALFSAPLMAFVAATLFSSAVVCAVALAPTHLKAKYFCAISTLLVPVAAENYGVLLYSVWWTGILIALALLWDTSKGLHWLRLAFLIIGGLSTPFVILVTPLFVIRAYREPTVNEMSTVLVAGVVFIIAALVALSSAPPQPFDANLTVAAALLTVSKFFGLFIVPGATIHIFMCGCLIILGVAALAIHERQKLDFYFFLLAMLLGASVAANIARAPMTDIHPFGSGPRYFFLPYIFLSFILLWLWSVINPAESLLKAAPIVVLALAIAGGIRQPFFTHPLQDRTSWPNELARCATTQGETRLVIGYTWEFILTQGKCRSIIDRSIVSSAAR